MNLSDAQLRKLFSGIYARACMDENINMLDFVSNFENIRQQLIANGGAGCWNFMKLNKSFFNQQPNLQFVLQLQQAYYNELNNTITGHISSLLATAPQQAWETWLQEYAAAVVNWCSKVYEPLCRTQFGFTEDQQKKIEFFKKLNQYILYEKWVNALPFYEALAKESCLSKYQQSCFNVVAGQIVLYWMPEMSKSVAYFETAKNLLPDNWRAVRAMGEYYLRNQEYEKARNAFLSSLSLQPNDPENYIYMADSYKDERKLETAEQWYNDAINLNLLYTESHGKLIQLYGQPEWAATKKQLIDELLHQVERIETNLPIETGLYNRYRDAGHAYIATPDYEMAKKYYEKAYNLRKDLITAKLDLGYTCGYMNDLENAQKWFNLSLSTGALAAEPLNFDTYWALAWLHEQAAAAKPTDENINKAIEYYEKCGALRNEIRDIIYNAIGILYFNAGNYSKALAYYMKAIDINVTISVYADNYRNALSKITDFTTVEIDTTNPHILNETGNFFYSRDDIEKAKKYYQQAIAIKQDPLYYKNLGLAEEKSGELEAAEVAFKKAAELDSTSGSSQNQLGVFYYNNKQYDKAIVCYREALLKEPANGVYLQNLGYAYESIFAYDAAKRLYNQLLAANAANANIWHRLAIISINTKDYIAGLSAIAKALELDPGNITYLKSEGSIYENLKNDEAALNTYLKALAINNSDDYFNNRVGIIYYRKNNPESLKQSIAYYKKAIEAVENEPSLKSYHAVYLQNLGLALADTGDSDAAEKAYLQSLDLDPGNAENFNNAGVFYFKIANWTSALNMFQQALKLDPQNLLYYRNLADTYGNMGDSSNADSMNEKANELEKSGRVGLTD